MTLRGWYLLFAWGAASRYVGSGLFYWLDYCAHAHHGILFWCCLAITTAQTLWIIILPIIIIHSIPTVKEITQ